MAEISSFTKKYANHLGKTLGNYTLEQLAEQTETGPDFLARQTNAQGKQFYRLRLLALPAGLTSEERVLYLGHFQREAGQVAALQHMALLPLCDYGICEGTPYLVSPDLPVRSLHRMLAQQGPLEARLAGRYLDQIAAALEHAHQQGIFHLNLNARNVFVQANGQPLVADLGLVRMLAPQTFAAIPAVAGKPELENGSPLLRDRASKPLYGLNLASGPAPELLLGQPLDASTDVYSLGFLLYYLLTGHRPLRGHTLAEIAHQHLNVVTPPLNTWRQDLPPEVDNLLSSAMAREPARRPQHPADLANAYAAIVAPHQDGRQAIARSALPPASFNQTAPQARSTSEPVRHLSVLSLSRRHALTLLAAGGGVAATGITAWLLAQHSSETAPGAGSDNSSSTPNTTTSSGAQGQAGGSGSPGHPGTVIANTGDVPLNSAKTFSIANSSNPGVLVHLQDKRFVAFNSTCTHAGCAVTYNRQSHLLECPCHSATFDPANNAAVTGGPAPAPLTAIAIAVNGDGTITTSG